ncbi:MAG: hypothetical protein HY328_17805 [Chloroflexi bacterium]|nr:hypothetical protein [Chloroflexota bacterium]
MNRGSAQTDSEPLQWGRIGQYILVYIFWFLFCALAFWAIWLIRTNLVEDIFFMRVNPWQLRAIDRWSIWVMGAGWVVGIFLVEGYLRKSIEQGRLLVSTSKLFLLLGVVIAASYIIHAL